jgi:hypothetical protein
MATTGMQMMFKALGIDPAMFQQVGNAVTQIAADIKATRESQGRTEIAMRAVADRLLRVEETLKTNLVASEPKNGRR